MKLLFAFLFCLITANSFSQRPVWKSYVGINCMFSQTNLDDNDFIPTEKPRPGFDIGMNIETRLNKNFVIEGGLAFSLNRSFFQRVYFFPSQTLQLYFATEYCSISNIKLPAMFLLKANSAHPFFFGAGPVLKYNINVRHRDYPTNADGSFESSFKLRTESGSRIGCGLVVAAGQQFGRKRKEIRLNYDVDISRWRYMTDPKYEEVHYSPFNHHTLSLQFSMEVRKK